MESACIFKHLSLDLLYDPASLYKGEIRRKLGKLGKIGKLGKKSKDAADKTGAGSAPGTVSSEIAAAYGPGAAVADALSNVEKNGGAGTPGAAK